MEDRRWLRRRNACIPLGLTLFLGGLDCAGGDNGVAGSGAGGATPNLADAAAAADAAADATAPPSAANDSICPASAVPIDLCTALPSGTVSPCSRDSAGQPSQNGYLEILAPTDHEDTYVRRRGSRAGRTAITLAKWINSWPIPRAVAA